MRPVLGAGDSVINNPPATGLTNTADHQRVTDREVTRVRNEREQEFLRERRLEHRRRLREDAEQRAANRRWYLEQADEVERAERIGRFGIGGRDSNDIANARARRRNQQRLEANR